MSITQNLVTHIRSRVVRAADRHHAALFMLDALASAYAGSSTPVGRKLINWGRHSANSVREQSFLMGALTHITETDDLHRASVTHPGCVVVPAVLAAVQRSEASAHDVLDATLSGFEAMCRIGRAVGPAHYKVWHNTASCGPFGSAMALADLYSLSDEQCVHALGNAGTQSSGLWQFLKTGAMSKHLHAGRASEAGVLAAELAQYDFTGAPDILEGEQGVFIAMCPDANPDAVLANPDAVWELVQTSIKPWPSCRHTHPAIDAALELNAQLGNAIVESVTIDAYKAALNICDRPTVTNEYQAKFSLQHCVATALSNGRVGLDSFSASAREAVDELLPKTTVQLSNEVEARYPESWGVIVSCKLSDGRDLSSVRIDCKGDPELPLSDDEMINKARSLLDFGGLSAAQSDAVVNDVLGLADGVSNSHLMDGFMQHIMR